MKNVSKIIFVILITSMSLSCSPSKKIEDNTPKILRSNYSISEVTQLSDGEDLYRFIDEEAQVVCWLAVGTSISGSGSPYGISCLPIVDTMIK